MIITESKLLHFEPDPQYPNILLKQKKLVPTIITRHYIENGVQTMLAEYRQSKISIVQARCYLKYLGLNNSIINKIVANKNEDYHVPSSWYNHND